MPKPVIDPETGRPYDVDDVFRTPEQRAAHRAELAAHEARALPDAALVIAAAAAVAEIGRRRRILAACVGRLSETRQR